ncbi:hypothetical protein [Rhodococcus maanshanensis]|uniref:Uncharacterized protein n=1 Tax=Rhodococcus maanshanensis TaxID=183556 RepID=A0A1H7PIU2_9NOCA|nr:hypothetical protein [Rhodococcus maanshanensis]SEL35205.1 hypothetical protein SAMN05444583_10856 [Rhodococcus maanshanensis]
MSGLPSGVDGIIRAIFAYEFEDQDMADEVVIGAIRSGEFGEFLDTVGSSGMFTPSVVETIGAAWSRDPELLVDALLDGVGSVARATVA